MALRRPEPGQREGDFGHKPPGFSHPVVQREGAGVPTPGRTGKTGRTSVMYDLLAGPAGRDWKWFCVFICRGRRGLGRGAGPGKVRLFRLQRRPRTAGEHSIQRAFCPTTHPEGNGGDFMATLFALSA